jgi:hypothetical protein
MRAAWPPCRRSAASRQRLDSTTDLVSRWDIVLGVTRGELRLASLPFGATLLVFVLVRLALPFDGLYGQDAYAYYDVARRLGPWLAGVEPLPPLYWPLGYPALVALLLPISGGGPAAGQIVSLLGCATGAAATALLVGELGALRRPVAPRQDDSSQIAASVAGMAVALAGGTLRSSQVVMADGLALGAVAVAMLAAARHSTGRGRGWLIVAALALAWGTITRWLVGLCALPLVAYVILAARARPVPAGDRHRRAAAATVVTLALALAVALAVLLPQLALSHANPVSFERHAWLVGWSPANAFRRDLHTPDGHAVYRLPVSLFYLARLAWPDFFFPTLALLAALGAAALARRRAAAELALLAGWPAAAWLFLAGIPYENPRFLLPVLPAMAALAGIGFHALVDGRGRGARRALALALAASLAAGLALGAGEHARLVARKDRDHALCAWVAARVPAGATLLAFGPTLTLQHYGRPDTRELFFVDDAELARLAAPERAPLYVVIDVANAYSQWRDLRPHRHLEALRARTGLTAVATLPPYTLLRAGDN